MKAVTQILLGETIIISDAEIVRGNTLTNIFKRPMYKIYVKNIDGYYIDEPKDKGVDWRDYKGKQVSNVNTFSNYGFLWLKFNNNSNSDFIEASEPAKILINPILPSYSVPEKLIKNSHSIIISSVEIVEGVTLNPNWKHPMYVIKVDNKLGFYIDNVSYKGKFHLWGNEELIHWENYIGKQISNVVSKFDSGHDWLLAINNRSINMTTTFDSKPEIIPPYFPNIIRNKYPTPYRTDDGHYVRSKAELIIDNYLYKSDIVHEYEKILPTEKIVISDFYLQKYNCYIEYWGLTNDTEYNKRRKEKEEIYHNNGLDLIGLVENDILDINNSTLQKFIKDKKLK